MDLTSNLLSPPILFFVLGFVAVLLKSDLDVPQPIPKLLSLYLLLAIGFKGGLELRHSGLTLQIGLVLASGVVMATLIPLGAFFVLRPKLGIYNAAAVAATYGSISAVTFITAANFLERQSVPFGGHMVAAMALMESPAIVIAVLLARLHDPARKPGQFHTADLLREAFFNGPVLLLVGALIIGVIATPVAAASLKPLTHTLFPGVLTLFLLDMGLVAARQTQQLRSAGLFLTTFALLVPLLNATLGILVARALSLPPGDALMFTILCASASYIAVPAALRTAIPEANPSLYVPMSLAITFPLNIALGIPLYWTTIQSLWP